MEDQIFSVGDVFFLIIPCMSGMEMRHKINPLEQCMQRSLTVMLREVSDGIVFIGKSVTCRRCLYKREVFLFLQECFFSDDEDIRSDLDSVLVLAKDFKTYLAWPVFSHQQWLMPFFEKYAALRQRVSLMTRFEYDDQLISQKPIIQYCYPEYKGKQVATGRLVCHGNYAEISVEDTQDVTVIQNVVRLLMERAYENNINNFITMITASSDQEALYEQCFGFKKSAEMSMYFFNR